MHDFVEKPWGSYKVIYQDNQCRIKVLKLEPNQEIKLHAHYQRDEQWTVVMGEGLAKVGGAQIALKDNDKVFVERGVQHSLKNTSVYCSLKIVEIQTGKSFSDDDIERFL